MSHDPYVAPIAHLERRLPAVGAPWRHALGVAWIALTAAAIALAVAYSLDPEKYFFYSDEDRATWEFRPVPVAVICTLMALEALWLHRVWFGRLWSRAWLRALVALVAFAPWTFLVTMVVMHQPEFVMVHITWTWLISVALTRRRARSTDNTCCRRDCPQPLLFRAVAPANAGAYECDAIG